MVAALLVSDWPLVSGVRGAGVAVLAGGAGHRLLLVPATAGIVGRHQRLVRNVIIDHVIRRVKYYTIIIGLVSCSKYKDLILLYNNNNSSL